MISNEQNECAKRCLICAQIAHCGLASLHYPPCQASTSISSCAWVISYIQVAFHNWVQCLVSSGRPPVYVSPSQASALKASFSWVINHTFHVSRCVSIQAHKAEQCDNKRNLDNPCQTYNPFKPLKPQQCNSNVIHASLYQFTINARFSHFALIFKLPGMR